MSKKIKYTDEPIGDVEIVENFLPPPEALVFREEGVKLTLEQSHKRVDLSQKPPRKHTAKSSTAKTH